MNPKAVCMVLQPLEAKQLGTDVARRWRGFNVIVFSLLAHEGHKKLIILTDLQRADEATSFDAVCKTFRDVL